jgi:hypothetical protein
MWGGSIDDVDDLSQPHRITRDLATLVTQRLAELQQPTWLILDEFDLVNLDATAIELLRKLCENIQAGECPQLWLFLFGLDPNKLGARIAQFLPMDVVTRPSRQDIEEYVTWFAGTMGKPLLDKTLKTTVDVLDGTLAANPDHASWDRFHDVLKQKCSGIAQGALK